MAGRRPKPSEVKRAAGNPGKRRLPPPDPSVIVETADPPPWLNARARVSWVELAPELVFKRVLSKSDLSGFAALCVVHARWREAEEHVAREGVMVKIGKRTAYNAWLPIANKAFEQFRKMAVEYGITPAARSRVAGHSDRKKNRFDKFQSGAREGGAHGGKE